RRSRREMEELRPDANAAAAAYPIETSDVPFNQLRKRSHATHRARWHPTQRLCCNLRPLL
ncbi:hypothetical protein FIBSPDRAFT_880220, partial [Athelia psychrophila]